MTKNVINDYTSVKYGIGFIYTAWQTPIPAGFPDHSVNIQYQYELLEVGHDWSDAKWNRLHHTQVEDNGVARLLWYWIFKCDSAT